jgi:lipid II:glycine glycyltransferase (peptidoglycan interpeptide bridge formation enzyme)
MLLYWSFMEYACDSGFKYFDFGRSTPDEGTYKFKEQWGARAAPLYWYYLMLKKAPSELSQIEQLKFSRLIEYWRKLPVPLTAVIGPILRKQIAL